MSNELIENNQPEEKINNSGNNNPRKFAKNLLFVLLSNITTILSGVMIGFIIPKLMNVFDYGLYKTYTLYATYIGLFHLGFSDGIYLYFSGKEYDKIDKPGMRYYTMFIMCLSLLLSITTILLGLFLFSNPFNIIIVFLGLNVFSTHIILYYQGVIQATSRFKEYSIKTLVQNSINVISIILLTIFYTFNIKTLSYTVYLITITSINYFMAFWYVAKHRDITFGNIKKKEEYYSILKIIRIGLPVLFSNLIGTFILTMDRQFISILFDTETYALYAFAYNMLSLITTVISTLSVVLFPSLKQIKEEKLKDNYKFLNGSFLLIVFFMLVLYFPLYLIVKYFLPNYFLSIEIFRIILPGIALSSSITIIMNNIYKKLNKTDIYFWIAVGAMILSIIANFTAYYIYKSPLAISIASIITILIWYFVTELYIIKRFRVNVISNYLFAVISICGFYLITSINNILISFAVYLLFFVLICIILKRRDAMKILRIMKTIIKKK